MTAFNDVDGVPASANRDAADRRAARATGASRASWSPTTIRTARLIAHGLAETPARGGAAVLSRRARHVHAERPLRRASAEPGRRGRGRRRPALDRVGAAGAPRQAGARPVRRSLSRAGPGAFDPAPPRALARETARRCPVLLKNDGGVLPLKPGAARRPDRAVRARARASERRLGDLRGQSPVGEPRGGLLGLAGAWLIVASRGAGSRSRSTAASTPPWRPRARPTSCCLRSARASTCRANRARAPTPACPTAQLDAGPRGEAGRQADRRRCCAPAGRWPSPNWRSSPTRCWSPGSSAPRRAMPSPTSCSGARRAERAAADELPAPCRPGADLLCAQGDRPPAAPATPTPFTARYIDVEPGPLFPFGHGLGYGRAEYGPTRVDARRARLGRDADRLLRRSPRPPAPRSRRWSSSTSATSPPAGSGRSASSRTSAS